MIKIENQEQKRTCESCRKGGTLLLHYEFGYDMSKHDYNIHIDLCEDCDCQMANMFHDFMEKGNTQLLTNDYEKFVRY